MIGQIKKRRKKSATQKCFHKLRPKATADCVQPKETRLMIRSDAILWTDAFLIEYASFLLVGDKLLLQSDVYYFLVNKIEYLFLGNLRMIV